MTLTYDPQWNWFNEALDDSEPPIDDGWWDSIEEQDAQEEAENGDD